MTDVTETLIENVKTTVGAAVNEKLSDMKKNDYEITIWSNKLVIVEKEKKQKPVTHDPLESVLIGVTEGEHTEVEKKCKQL